MRVGDRRWRWVRVFFHPLRRMAGEAIVWILLAYGLGSLAAQYPMPVLGGFIIWNPRPGSERLAGRG